MEKPSVFERFNAWARKSVTLKLISIGFLILILLIPSAMLTSLIDERENTRDAAVREVSDKWGAGQTVGGPVLTVPYRTTYKDEKGVLQPTTAYAHFLPEAVTISGKMDPQTRYRGIYEVILYNTRLQLKGHFNKPDPAQLNIPPGDFLLSEAFLSVGITDMRGIKDKVNLRWNDSTYEFNPGILTHDVLSSGVSVPVGITAATGRYSFDCTVNLNGSSELNFIPVGKETNVSLQSEWQNPSFEGSFLPDSRQVSEKGFTSGWRILHLNRNYPQQWRGDGFRHQAGEEYEERPANLYDSAFGVKLLLPIDEYQKTMRSAKYNIMFIFITFLAFFFVEVLNKKRIHPIQYLLVGFAITLFYILLLSLSEHISFNYSYLLSCVVILGLITFYAKSILRSNFLTGLMAGILALLYLFFYSLLQLQDYALLMGSIGLLVILAVIMYLSRNIDWYNLQRGESLQEGASTE